MSLLFSLNLRLGLALNQNQRYPQGLGLEWNILMKLFQLIGVESLILVWAGPFILMIMSLL